MSRDWTIREVLILPIMSSTDFRMVEVDTYCALAIRGANKASRT
jgi:hypothetical protein